MVVERARHRRDGLTAHSSKVAKSCADMSTRRRWCDFVDVPSVEALLGLAPMMRPAIHWGELTRGSAALPNPRRTLQCAHSRAHVALYRASINAGRRRRTPRRRSPT